ncbi:MAG: hypothetical protein WCR01_13285 [Bacteroidota bacterium]
MNRSLKQSLRVVFRNFPEVTDTNEKPKEVISFNSEQCEIIIIFLQKISFARWSHVDNINLTGLHHPCCPVHFTIHREGISTVLEFKNPILMPFMEYPSFAFRAGKGCLIPSVVLSRSLINNIKGGNHE